MLEKRDNLESMNDNALYLEADEDITSAIDKLRKQTGTSAQIVVPKRSALLQSLINLKLLKKAADDDHRDLVIVTTDRVASELAARVGIAVAPAVGAHASLAVPKGAKPLRETADDVVHAETVATAETGATAAAAAIDVTAVAATAAEGRLSGDRPLFVQREVGARAPNPLEKAGGDEAAEPTGRGRGAGRAIPKMLKIPNFSRFQHVIIWGVVVLAAVGGYFGAMYFLTKATVKLYAAASKINIDSSFSVDPAATASDIGKSVLAGQTIKIEKDVTQPFTPTGQKDAGAKATGTVTIYNYCYNPGTLPSGVTFTYSGQKFVSTAAVVVPPAVPAGGSCPTRTVATVAVAAAQNGDSYNVAGGVAMTFPAPAAAYGTYSYMNAESAAQFTGGLSKMVTVTTQDDVDKAKAVALAADKDGSYKDLAAKVADGSRAIDGSQTQTAGDATATPAVDAEGVNGSLTVHITYTELAIKQADLKTLLSTLATKQAGAENQVYDNGFDSARVTAIPSASDSSAVKSFKLTADAYGGAKIDTAALAKKIAGKRFSDASDLLNAQPGVQKVDIIMTPPWAGNLPSRVKQIQITIKVSGIGK
jgi:hypothetical protein